MSTPRPLVNDETSVLLIWPQKMAPEHRKVMHAAIVRDYLDEPMVERLITSFPRAANRYAIKFHCHAGATEFIAKFRSRPLASNSKRRTIVCRFVCSGLKRPTIKRGEAYSRWCATH